MKTSSHWKTVSSKYVYKNPWIKVRHDEFETPKGKKGVYGVVESKPYTMVIPIIDDRFYLVELYRYSISRNSIEFPAGKINVGETSENAARRELREETGLIASSLHKLGHLYAITGFGNDCFDVFVAEHCCQAKQKTEDTEEGMVVHRVGLHELTDMVISNTIIDSSTVAAFGLYQQYLLRI